MNSDLFNIIVWYITYFLIGFSFLPLTFYLFQNFRDKGYIFSKIIGSMALSYLIFVASFLHIIKFSTFSIYIFLLLLFFINYFLSYIKKFDVLSILKRNLKIFLFEELLFLATLIIWSFIRAHMPDINGLEKFMDFGFLNSIIRTDYFPPRDMWYTPLPINYYFFGHLITATITKLSFIPSYISYNLMIATIFALTFTISFSLVSNLINFGKHILKPIVGGLLAAILVTLGGNLTTIYAFFRPYTPADKPVPFWNLDFLPLNFPNDYWYPNATRFIPFTIHEFPLYSFVVSDLHGHVLDIPMVLLSIAYCFSILKKKEIKFYDFVFFSFFISVMYMTNAWDFLIYFVLFFSVVLYLNFHKLKKLSLTIYESLKNTFFVFAGFILFAIPFSVNFKPFASGIGVICAPKFLTSIGKIGPFLFEENHCQKSEIWQLVLLYGFFYILVILFLLFLKFKRNYSFSKTDIFILILITLSSILIIIPEFFYLKDIYPLHYRANTMFKLVYESFIMLSIVSSFIIIKLLSEIKNKIILFSFFLISLILVSFILIYPIFAVNSYYRDLKSYKSLDGIAYLNKAYPKDYNLINWLNKNVKGQPVILEANGDSYSDYARISANTGLPTVIGWTVHEWLWRGTYDVVSPRISDVQLLYTSKDVNLVSSLLKKYKISYVVISNLERQKYPNLTEQVFKSLGKVVFTSGKTRLYKINS